MTSPKQNSGAWENLILIILAFICVSISFIQTARGYDELAGPVFNWAFSIVISLFILLLNYRFRDHLRNGFAIWGILGFYLLVTTFSFAGNFNAFYSQFMRKELYEDELKTFRSELEGVQQQAITSLNNSNNAEDIRATILPLKRAMEAQITNPGNPGMGQRTKELIKEIEAELGTTVTILRGKDYTETAQLMGDQVENLLNDQLSVLTGDANKLVTQINIMADSIKPEIDQVLLDNQLLEANGKLLLDETARIHNTIGELSQGYLGVDQFEYEPLRSKNSQVGKISHSFQSAMRGDNPQAAWIAGVASLAVDLLVPLYIILTVRRKEDDDEDIDDDWNDGGYYEKSTFGGLKRVGPKVAS
ncbi:MAG: MARVEL domain-containing protein [Bacteroidota bacterium]